MPQIAIEHHRAVLGLLRSSRNRWHSSLAQGRRRPGLLIRRVSQARTARAAGLPAGWGSETPVTPLLGSLGPGPQLHVAPDGTIRYLAATDPSGYKGQHKI